MAIAIVNVGNCQMSEIRKASYSLHSLVVVCVVMGLTLEHTVYNIIIIYSSGGKRNCIANYSIAVRDLQVGLYQNQRVGVCRNTKDSLWQHLSKKIDTPMATSGEYERE